MRINRKKRWIGILALVVLLCLLAGFAAPELFRLPVIGRVYGTENQFLEIDGAVYERTTSDPYTSVDRARYIGSVKNEAITMRIYEYKGEDDREYLHALWEWEGYTYMRLHE